jgi:nitronate monooxygenase
MMDTSFTKLLGISAPIQLAGMPGITTNELVCAVANAGGLGMLGAAGAPFLTPDSLGKVLGEMSANTSGVFGVNFLMPFLERDCIEVAAKNAAVVEFFYGDPSGDLIEEVHKWGALASWQVGSLAEALAAERAGCDFIAVQGTEAGGHVRGSTSLLPLLSETLEQVKIPVLAAGGVATHRDMAAVLACGASGARIGTRFVASKESGAHPDYIDALIAASASDTALTEVFSAMWPDAPHRVLQSAIAAVQDLEDEVIGHTSMFGQSYPVTRMSSLSPTRETSGALAAMCLYAGESVSNITSVKAAADIVTELMGGAE